MEDLFADDEGFTVVKPSQNQTNYEPEPEQLIDTNQDENEEWDPFAQGTQQEHIKEDQLPQTQNAEPVPGKYVDPVSVDSIMEDDLGLDNVNIMTRRKLVVLSEDQLLSNHGLPLLKLSFNKKVRFKSSTYISKNSGKKKVSFATEYENAGQMLNYYQLWAHKVFPKADFKTFIDICYNKNTLRKGRLVQYRRQWIQSEQDRLLGVQDGNIDLGKDDEVPHEGPISQEPFSQEPVSRSNPETEGLFVDDEMPIDAVPSMGQENRVDNGGAEASRVEVENTQPSALQPTTQDTNIIEHGFNENSTAHELGKSGSEVGEPTNESSGPTTNAPTSGAPEPEELKNELRFLATARQELTKDSITPEISEDELDLAPQQVGQEEDDHAEEMAILREMGL